MWLAWALSSAIAAAEPVERVILVVEEDIVLQSDLAFDAAITPFDTLATSFWTAPRPTPEDKLLEAAVLRARAGDVALYLPSDDEVAERVAAVRGAFGDSAAFDTFLLEWGLDEPAFSALVRRRMIVDRYLLRNVEAPRDDADRWWAEAREVVAAARRGARIRRIPEQR
jgi:hypothetical protein